MKNLKIKFGLFSLLAVLAVSVFLTSCEQVEPTTPIEESVMIDNVRTLQLPYLYEELNSQEIENYLSELSSEDLAVLEDNHRLKSYLTEIDKVQVAERLLQKGDVFSNIDLTAILTQTEIDGLQKFEVKPLVEDTEMVNGRQECRPTGLVTSACYRVHPYCTDGGVDEPIRYRKWYRQYCYGGYYLLHGPYCSADC